LANPEVTPYNNVESKREQVETMFDNIAPYYDLMNRVLSLGIDKTWRSKAIKLLQDLESPKILDVATGTCDVAIEMAKNLSNPSIIGLDISAKMLKVGQKKIDKSGLGDIISLTQGESENLPFDDNTFDAITVAFGVRNFGDLKKGLAEIRRVLKTDGQLIVLEFSKPTMFPFKQGFNFYFKNILPRIGKLTSKDPKAYTYLYESVQAFPDGDNFIKVLDSLDYKKSTCTPLTVGICSIYHSRK
jgi:demethylmenaquinone methyltransferase/2-methoxy-6-polyprenyl-1,4-benzoquinol methylase